MMDEKIKKGLGKSGQAVASKKCKIVKSMTLVVGFKWRTSVFLVADSALTATGSFEDPSASRAHHGLSQSSFGEKNVFKPESASEHAKYVQEGTVKVQDLSNRLIIGFAGLQPVADQVINELKSLIRDDEYSLAELKSRILRSINFGTDLQRDCQLIVGFSDQAGEAHLLTYNVYNNGAIDEHSEIAAIGALRRETQVEPRFAKMFRGFADKSRNDNSILASCLVSFIASHNVGNYRNFENGIGGLFSVLSVSDKGILWHEDTLYLIYDTQREIFQHSMLLRVDDGLFMSVTAARTLILGARTITSINEIQAQASALIQSKAFIKYVVILPVFGGTSLIIQRSVDVADSIYCRLQVNGFVKIEFTPFLRQLLAQMNPGDLGFFYDKDPSSKDVDRGFMYKTSKPQNEADGKK